MNEENMNLKLDVLVVDDESDIRSIISDILEEEGYSPRVAKDSREAFDEINKKVPNAIILDIWLQNSDLDGLSMLEQIKKKYPLLPVVIISGHGTIQTAVSAIKLGAYDYIEKPFTHSKLMIVLKRACEVARLKKENLDLKSKIVDRGEMVGNSSQMVKLKNEIDKIAPTASRILITGPIGSGKELTARLIHKKSKYSNGPFVSFCPVGLSAERIEQELFGDCKLDDGSKLSVRRVSILEATNKGTLYIDEISDLPLSAQARLMKVIQQNVLEKQDGSIINLDLRNNKFVP
jgi:two-component system, NtrC family, nitrogen regulation response regulator NtrX